MTTEQYEKKIEWVKGLPPKAPIHENTLKFLDTIVYPHFYGIFEIESDKTVIEKTLECLTDINDHFGPGGIIN